MEPLTKEEIRTLIIERGLTLTQLIEAVSSVQELVLVGLENFDRNITIDAQRRQGH